MITRYLWVGLLFIKTATCVQVQPFLMMSGALGIHETNLSCILLALGLGSPACLALSLAGAETETEKNKLSSSLF